MCGATPRSPVAGCRTFGLGYPAPMSREIPLVARALIVGSAVLYVLSLALDPSAALRDLTPLGFLSPSSFALYSLGMTGMPVWQDGWWWTVLTATYLHGGLLHLVFNMMWLWNLAPMIRQGWGTARFFLIFNAGGIVGFLASNAISGAPTIGASGGVFGLIAALIVLSRRVGAHDFARQIWQTATFLFLVSFVMPNVNNWGHAGGFAGGWAAAWLLPLERERQEAIAERLLAGGLVAATLGGMVASYLLVRGLTGQ